MTVHDGYDLFTKHATHSLQEQSALWGALYVFTGGVTESLGEQAKLPDVAG